MLAVKTARALRHRCFRNIAFVMFLNTKLRVLKLNGENQTMSHGISALHPIKRHNYMGCVNKDKWHEFYSFNSSLSNQTQHAGRSHIMAADKDAAATGSNKKSPFVVVFLMGGISASISNYLYYCKSQVT